eukprot:523813-Lingulodinium_polyedra.AAC.1
MAQELYRRAQRARCESLWDCQQAAVVAYDGWTQAMPLWAARGPELVARVRGFPARAGDGRLTLCEAKARAVSEVSGISVSPGAQPIDFFLD